MSRNLKEREGDILGDGKFSGIPNLKELGNLEKEDNFRIVGDMPNISKCREIGIARRVTILKFSE